MVARLGVRICPRLRSNIYTHYMAYTNIRMGQLAPSLPFSTCNRLILSCAFVFFEVIYHNSEPNMLWNKKKRMR